jgi:acylphosphatase
MDERTVKCTIEGRVQGVFYRAATAERATRLGLRGWVRNRSDGRVELLVCGEPAALEELIAWLWQGPDQARVTAVAIEQCSDDPGREFRIVA